MPRSIARRSERCSLGPAFLTVGILILGMASSAHAQTPVCGNGVIEKGEACDDGNLLDGDGCSAVCTIEQQCYDPANTFSFFLWSDSYTSAGDAGVSRLFADAVNAGRYPGRVIPRFWIATGDIPFMETGVQTLDDLNDLISNSASGANYPFMCPASNGKFPYFVAIGNHDVDGFTATTPRAQYDYWSNFVGPRLSNALVGITNFKLGPDNGYDARTNYSFDYKNAHFIVVNQYYADPTYPTSDPIACIRPALYDWIDRDLAASTKPLKFVFGHEPAWSYCSNLPGYGGDFCPADNIDNQTPAYRTRPYSSTGSWLEPFGGHWGDSLEDNRCPAGSRDAFWTMLAGHDVIAHFAGHTHTYSGRLVQGDGVPRNDVSAYSKTGETYLGSEGVWEVNTGQAHNSAGTAYILVTVRDETVTFEAYDQITYATDEPFQLVETWNVSLAPSTNHQPVLSPIPGQTVTAGQLLTFTASATDPDADQTLAFSLSGAPSGAAIDAASGVFAWTPTSAQVGTFSFWAKVTDNGTPPLSALQPVAVNVMAPLPDLTETAVSSTATAVAAGAVFQVSDTVTNQGSASSPGFVVAFHLSSDSSYGGSDDIVLGGTRSVSSLGASASSGGTTSVTVPKTTPSGVYFVCALADSGGAVAESSETNNSTCSGTTVVVTGPDLVMTQVQPGVASLRLAASPTLPVTDTVQNSGGVAAAAFKVGFTLSLNQTYGDADDVAISTTRSVGALAPGASSQGTTKLKLPGRMKPGTYYVCALADSAHVVAETNETNNTRCSATPVRIDP